jgi:hypothetical protein
MLTDRQVLRYHRNRITRALLAGLIISVVLFITIATSYAYLTEQL